MDNPTQERLRFVFDYDPLTGVITWKNPTSNRVKKGDVAGKINSIKGSRYIGVDNKLHAAHRLIWCWMLGYWPPLDIDHIDRNPANNAWKNLRQCSRDRNCQNQSLKLNVSGFKGVTKRGKSYMARIRTKGHVHHLGSFPNAISAARAYDKAALTLHGPYAATNSSFGLFTESNDHG